MKKIVYVLGIIAAIFSYGCCEYEEFAVQATTTFSDLVIKNNNLFLVGAEELITLNLTQPSVPVERARVPLAVSPESVSVGDACVLMNTNQGLIPYSIISAEVGSLVDNIGGCSAIPMAIDENILASCTAINGRLRVATYNLDFGKNLTRRQEIPISNELQSLALDSDWLFVLNRFSGLEVFNIAGENPELRHTITRPMGTDLVLQQNRLMISGGDSIYQYSYNLLEDRIDFLSSFPIN